MPRPALAVVYEHFCPQHVPALRRAQELFGESGWDLLPAEIAGRSGTYGWTREDAPRPERWRCLFPGRRPRAAAAVRAVLAFLRDTRPDVVAVNGWFDPVSWAVVLRRKSLGVRVVVVTDSTEADRRRTAWRESLKRTFLRRTAAAFAAGTRQAQYLRGLGVAEDRIVPGCDVVDNAHFAAARARRRPRRVGPAVLGTAARFVPRKNLEAALEAFAAVARRSPPGSLLWRVAGTGPGEEALRKRARATGAPVEFAGFVPYAGMPGFYAGIDLLWVPSRSEPWGLVVNEAMAAGLPVLASAACGCVEDLLAADNGWTHPPGPAAALEEGLRRALADRERWEAMGRASAERIAQWGPDRYASGLLRAAGIAEGSAPR
jgi:glycosyltransferase involved in cell wall biosynthesis